MIKHIATLLRFPFEATNARTLHTVRVPSSGHVHFIKSTVTPITVRAGGRVRTTAPCTARVPVATPSCGVHSAPQPAAVVQPLVDRDAERRLITQLLSHFKQTAEVRQYMKYYGSVGSDRFAIIKISGDLLHDATQLHAVASSLAFLHRIGLVPVVVHGAGVFSGRRCKAVESAAKPIAGETPETTRNRLMSAAAGYMCEANEVLVDALRKEGVAATSLLSSVFQATPHPHGTGVLAGISGRIDSVDIKQISDAISKGVIPVVASLSKCDEHGQLTFPTQDATLELAKAIKPLKIITLRPEGGLQTPDGSAIRSVDLSMPLPTGLSASEAECVAQLAELYSKGVEGGEKGASVSVTKPENLAAELFTNKGAGTIVLKGERILSYSDLTDVDTARVVKLIQEAFGATLPDDYFTKLAGGEGSSRKLRRLLVSESYRAVAIVSEEAGLPGVAYLDKFAVSPSAQGDKLGEVLWRQMVSDEPVLYWRSRSANRVNPWYYEQSTGCFKNKAGDWTIFWRNLDDTMISQAISTALKLAPTFPIKVYPQPTPGNNNSAASAHQPTLK